jgi:hypothetical protein
MSQDSKNTSPATQDEEDIDLSGLIEKVIELQDSLLQSQEKNLVLSAQARELDQVARDAEDMKAELAAQSLLLADKSRENKHLHQELSRVTSLLDVKLIELEELKTAVIDLGQQMRAREAERDRLAVMLNEAENAQRRAEAEKLVAQQDQTAKGWPFSGKGKKT